MPRDPLGPESYVTCGAVEFRKRATRIRSRAYPWAVAGYFAILGTWAVLASLHTYAWLGALAAFVYLELALVQLRATQLIGGVEYDGETATRIAAPLAELCASANCAVPRVTIMSRSARSAFVRGRRDEAAQLVVTRPLLDRLDDLELRAVLAHEVSHLASGDLGRSRLRARVAALLIAVAAIAIVVLLRGDDVSFAVFLSWIFAGTIVAVVFLSLAQRPSELRADAGAVRLTADPGHLVSAVAKVTALGGEVRRQTFAGPWRWLLAPFNWKAPSHPTLAKRSERIRALAGDGPVGR